MKKVLLIALLSWFIPMLTAQTFYSELCKNYRYSEFIEKNNNKAQARSLKYENQHDLALSYLFVQNPSKAVAAFESLQVKFAEKFNDEDRFYMALSLLRLGMKDQAKILIDEAKNNQYKPALESFYNLEINSAYWNYNSFEVILTDSNHGNYNLVLSQDNQGKYLGLFSNNDDKTLSQKKSAVADKPFYSLNVIDLKQQDYSLDAKRKESVRIGKYHRINSHYQPSQFWPNEKKFIFTENAEKPNFNNERVLKVYLGFIEGEENIRKVPLNINTDSFSISSLVISPNQKMVVFASNGFNSKGMSDLFKADLVEFTNESFKVANVQPLDNKVNTSLRDNFPWFLNDSTLVFSSEGHWGLGGLDIYQYQMNTGQMAILPGSINSLSDDFGFTSAGNFLSFSSNRDNGLYKDKIYCIYAEAGNESGFKPFEVPVQIEEVIAQVKSKVTVIDAKSKLPIKDPKIDVVTYDEIPTGVNDTLIIIDAETRITKLPTSEGLKQLNVQQKKNLIAVSKPGYYKQLVSVNNSSNIDSSLKFNLTAVAKNDELGLDRGIGPVYYELDKYDLDSNDMKSLDQLAVFLIDNPTAVIELRSHTDSRASGPYNIALSKKRTNSAQTYLTKTYGFPKTRFVSTWVGETQLARKCPDGVNCDELQHALNRRTTFHILNMKYKGMPFSSELLAKNRSRTKIPGTFVSDESLAHVYSGPLKNTVNTSKSSSSVTAATGGISEYRIQFLLSPTQKGLKNVKKTHNLPGIYEYRHNGYFKYTTGVFSSYDEAQKKVMELRQQGLYKDCFVVEFKNNQRVN